MHRSRITISFAGLAAALLAAPILATAVLAADPTVVVKAGDTLTSLAKRHGVEIVTLVEVNDLADPNRIYVGQHLRIPTAPPAVDVAAAPAAAARTHVVASGEHVTGIARRYQVTIAAIVDANRLADASRIFAGQRLAIPGPAAPAAGLAMPAEMAALVGKRDAVRRVIIEEAERFDVPGPLALAVAWQESGWRQGVVSHAGAVGVMQLMPATAVWVGDAMLGTPVAINDTRHNVRAGVRLLAHYLDRYDGNRDRVLAAYYQGQWATDHHGIYAVSRPYIASIKALESMFAR